MEVEFSDDQEDDRFDVVALATALGTFRRTLRNRALAAEAELLADKKCSG